METLFALRGASGRRKMILFCRSRARDGFVRVSELSAVRTRWFGSEKKCLAGKRSDLWGRSGEGGAYSALLIKKWTVSTSGFMLYI